MDKASYSSVRWRLKQKYSKLNVSNYATGCAGEYTKIC